MDPRERYGDIVEQLESAMDGRQANIWTAQPGIVEAIGNLGTNLTVSVRPATRAIIKLPTGVTQAVKLPLIPDVPIMFPAGGGFTMTFPVKLGDEVLLVHTGRSIDNWWGLGGFQTPSDVRMHDINDCFAIPGPKSVPKAKGFNPSASTVQLRSNDGSIVAELDTVHGINLTCPGTVTLNAPVTNATGNLSVGSGATGTFTSSTGQTITVQDGIIINIF